MASPSTAAADQPSSRLRAYGRLAALGVWFLACILPHLIARLFGGSRWPRRFMRGAARICGADVAREGAPARPGTLLVANHVSWLDIPVLCAATGCAFISKVEMAGHPVMRWFADQNATVYVDRTDKRGIRMQADSLVEALRRGAQPLALFPEGTVGDGRRLLPFKPPLFSAVADPSLEIRIRPVAIDYGRFVGALGWSGEPGVQNFLRVLGRRGRIPVTVRLLEPIAPSSDRKSLARAAHDAVAEALAPSGIAPAGV